MGFWSSQRRREQPGASHVSTHPTLQSYWCRSPCSARLRRTLSCPEHHSQWQRSWHQVGFSAGPQLEGQHPPSSRWTLPEVSSAQIGGKQTGWTSQSLQTGKRWHNTVCSSNTWPLQQPPPQKKKWWWWLLSTLLQHAHCTWKKGDSVTSVQFAHIYIF